MGSCCMFGEIVPSENLPDKCHFTKGVAHDGNGEMFWCFQNICFADGRREVAFDYLNGRSCQSPNLWLTSPRLFQQKSSKIGFIFMGFHLDCDLIVYKLRFRWDQNWKQLLSDFFLISFFQHVGISIITLIFDYRIELAVRWCSNQFIEDIP